MRILLTLLCFLSVLPSSHAALAVERLRCEYLPHPLGIDAAQPRLDWLLISTGATPRNLKQGSYHILVASTPELLAQNHGDLWDSGDVASDSTSQIVYAGSTLTSRERCYWKVQVRDSAGGSTWSQPASWEMGLLQPSDWKAQWIESVSPTSTEPAAGPLTIVSASYHAIDDPRSRDVTEAVRRSLQDNRLAIPVANDALGGDPALNHVKELRVTYTVGSGPRRTITAMEPAVLTIPPTGSVPYLRKDFTLAKPIARARIYATALGLYELHLNGQRVGDQIFPPGWTDYDKRLRYQVYDITTLLKPGANTWGALLGNGWYAGHIGNGGFQAYGKIPALFAQLEVTYADGSVETLVTDDSWKRHAGPIITSDFMLGEDYDAQREIPGWDKPGLDLAHWVPVTKRTEAARSMDGQVAPPVRQTGELRPRTVRKIGSTWIYDFGQNMVGFVRLKVDEPAGTAITLRHGEMLNPDGTLYTANLRSAVSVDRYTCRGGEETWQPHFTFHGFRYLEVSGPAHALAADDITGVVVGTDFPATGQFACSSGPINQLQSNIRWGMRGNYLSIPTDCPQRNERMGWMGDAEVFIRTAAYNGDVAAFFTKWLVDVDDTQLPGGEYTDISPFPEASHGGGGAPAWADAGVICPWTIYRMYGDTRILQQHLPNMARWVDWCQAHSQGLIRSTDRGADYGDWLAQGEDTPKDLIGTAYFAYSTSLVAKSYQAIGDQTNAAKYSQLFDQIKAAFNQKYVTADGHITGDTQSGYAMALRFNLLPDDLRLKAAGYLAANAARHGDHLTTGFIGVSYLLPALSSEQKLAEAYRLFQQTTFPSWLFSVEHGATTIWERWDGWTPEKGFQDPAMNSFNHYSLGSCGEWMFDSVAGIDLDPEHPAFKHIIIPPGGGGAGGGAHGAAGSVNGKIAVKWRLQSGAFTLNVTVPINTSATICLPTPDPSQVRESGRPIASLTDVRNIPDSGESRFEVGSGDYKFTCPASVMP